MTRILVVSGDALVTRFLSGALRSRGWIVDVAEDGATAAPRTATGQYDIVVVDPAQPRSGEGSILRALRAVRPEQKVMMVTGEGDTDAGIRALEAGASDYIARPFSVDELLARVAARVQEVAHRRSDRVLCCPGVTLDLARRKVDTGRGEISLTEREFVLLAFLMRQQGRVFSRQELLSEVWGLWFDPGSNVVDVNIRRLRSKLGVDLIETVRNVGYALRAS